MEKNERMEDLYFRDKVSEYIFYLVELKGKQQLDFLGITYDYYKDKKIAEKWHKEIVKLIHPDICKHPKAVEAMQVLEQLYRGMIPEKERNSWNKKLKQNRGMER